MRRPWEQPDDDLPGGCMCVTLLMAMAMFVTMAICMVYKIIGELHE